MAQIRESGEPSPQSPTLSLCVLQDGQAAVFGRWSCSQEGYSALVAHCARSQPTSTLEETQRSALPEWLFEHLGQDEDALAPERLALAPVVVLEACGAGRPDRVYTISVCFGDLERFRARTGLAPPDYYARVAAALGATPNAADFGARAQLGVPKEALSLGLLCAGPEFDLMLGTFELSAVPLESSQPPPLLRWAQPLVAAAARADTRAVALNSAVTAALGERDALDAQLFELTRENQRMERLYVRVFRGLLNSKKAAVRRLST